MPKNRPMEKKALPVFVTNVDEERGIVDAVVSVFGIIDGGDDLIEAGSFLKTLTERGRKVRVLNHHNSWDVRDVIGMPLSMREVGRDELPPVILERFPEATGGLMTSTQYLLDTPEGAGAFKRIKVGAIDEYSIGFQVMQAEYKRVPDASGKSRDIRVIKEIKLWEYSPVIWGMNPATATVGAKEDSGSATGGPVTLNIPYLVGVDGAETFIFHDAKAGRLSRRMGERLFDAQKTGRVLSDANSKRILEAWKALGDVLVAAGIALQEDVDSGDTVEEEDSKADAARVEPGQPLTPQSPEPSADTLKTQRERMLALIALEDGEFL